MKTTCLTIATVAVSAVACLAAEPQGLKIANADFESVEGGRIAGWHWWSRTNQGSAGPDAEQHHGGGRSARVRHDGPRDWAFSSDTKLPARPGQTYRVTGWVRSDRGTVELAVVATQKGKTLSWDIGSAKAGPTGGKWVKLDAPVEVPAGCDGIYVRFVGAADTLAWVDDVSLRVWKAPPRPPRPRVRGYAFGGRRIVEKLGRGLIARPIAGGKVYLGWRLLPADTKETAFHVHRLTGDGKTVRLMAEPIRRTTDYVDATAPAGMASTYFVVPIAGGKEGKPSRSVSAKPAKEPAAYLTVELDGDHTFQKAGIADLDGDGRYDFVLKQPHDNIDPWYKYWKKSPDTYKLEAYRHDGKLLWRHDLGWAIERGIWYSPYVVWDLDGDGRAEVAVKTGEGDPRGEDGKVRSGGEHVSILDGLTGKLVTKADWPARKHFTGDRAYNYASRNQLGIAYLDGKTPCLLVARGTYNVMLVDAWQLRGGRLERLWQWSNKSEPRTYWGQGAHWMHGGDVDGDGRDEVVLGSCVLDDNGRGLWSTGVGHPDHCYLGDLIPERPGLEIYYGIETSRPANTMSMVDAKTGKVLWGHKERTRHIHASGMCSDVDAAHAGAECYSGERDFKDKRWLRSCRGKVLSTADLGGLSPRPVHWDADRQRELLIGGRLYNYADYRKRSMPPRIEGRLVAVADILGDWREEIITSVAGQMRIYTTTIPAADRRACLMTDPIYRIDVAHAAMGYFQVPMLSYDVATATKR